MKELSRPRIDARSGENPPYGILFVPLGAFGLGCWQVRIMDYRIGGGWWGGDQTQAEDEYFMRGGGVDW